MSPKVISMVPSWTETLIAAGLNVVGRTKFCIHPKDQVKNIPVVGGTKNIHWDKVKQLNADILILDQDENTKEMADDSCLNLFVSHIQKVEDMSDCLNKMAQKLHSTHLAKFAERWRIIENAPIKERSLRNIPGILEWIMPEQNCTQFIYLIWRDPWMCASNNTFIGSVFRKLGLGKYHWATEKKYPEISLDDFDKQQTLLLCSTEPFPFHRKKQQMAQLGFSCATIDGEFFSWFGIRSLEFLENQIL